MIRIFNIHDPICATCEYWIEKDKNKKSGTGIGLSIVQESIKLCGGTVSVNNRPEGGLEYIFTLPPA